VDPLAPSYPWYTPYQFAGNMPISAIDLDGLEPKSVVNSVGKLTEPIIQFMNAAFNYDLANLRNTTWTNDKEFKWYKDGAIDRFSVTQAFNSGAGAITINSENVVYNQGWGKSTDEVAWIGLVGHEQSHIADYNGLGQTAFYIDYGIDNAELGYRGAFTEHLAYEREDALTGWLKKNPTLLNQLNNEFELSGRGGSGSSEGKRFRYEAGIDADISHLNYVIGYYQDRIKGVSELNSRDEIKDYMISGYSGLIFKLHEKISSLVDERKNIGDELKANNK
jgi:hypothetical protein